MPCSSVRLSSIQNAARAVSNRILHLGCPLFLSLFALFFAPAFAAPSTANPYGVDLSGHPIPSLTNKQTRAVVLVFVASDCPISNRYFPQIRRLEAEFEPQHVAFWVIYPNPADTASVIQQHQKDFGKTGAEIRDPNHTLVQLAHVKITPEAAVLLPDGHGFHETYVGRIDNRYIDFGQQRPQATQYDLQDAITSVLQGKTVRRPTGQPVGCFIVNQP